MMLDTVGEGQDTLCQSNANGGVKLIVWHGLWRKIRLRPRVHRSQLVLVTLCH